MKAAISQRDSGFTLIEFAVALAVVSLLIAALAPTVRFGKRAWEASAEIEGRSATPAALRFLEQRLEDARLILLRSEDNTFAASFSGTSDAMDFVAPQPPSARVGGLYRYRLTTERTVVGGTLALTFSPVVQGPVAGIRLDLASEVQDLSFRYFGMIDGAPEASWHAAWSGRDRLPLLVEIRATIGPPDRPTRHLVVVAPRNRVFN